jgi:hypothetical protein
VQRDVFENINGYAPDEVPPGEEYVYYNAGVVMAEPMEVWQRGQHSTACIGLQHVENPDKQQARIVTCQPGLVISESHLCLQ